MKKTLPIVSTPTLVLTLPLSGKKIKYRPFVVKEQKALALAKDSEDWETTFETLRSVLLSCTGGDVDISEVPMCDAAYLFIKLRIQSVGSEISFMTECDSCKEDIQINYDLSSVSVDTSSYKDTIELTDTVSIKMRAPTFKEIEYTNGSDDDTINFVVSLIEMIYTEDEIFSKEDYSKEELISWLEELSESHLLKIKGYIDNIPVVQQNMAYKCPKCGHEHDKRLEGLQDFF